MCRRDELGVLLNASKDKNVKEQKVPAYFKTRGLGEVLWSLLYGLRQSHLGGLELAPGKGEAVLPLLTWLGGPCHHASLERSWRLLL